MSKIHNLFAKFAAPSKTILSGAILIALFQVPVLPSVSDAKLPVGTDGLSSPLKTAYVAASQGEESSPVTNIRLAETFFGEVAGARSTQDMIDQKIEFVSTRKAYPASLAVIQRHEATIKEKARQRGVPEEVAIGIGLLENGGSDTAKSPAGALGVFQLMPGTAKNLGLTVNGKTDERRNPEKNIDAGMRYLRMNYERFGDWGLATWAYHAGEGNVSKALKLYAKANHGINLPGIKDYAASRRYVEKYGITIHKLLSDPAVKNFTKKLNDDSSGYPYKVIATATLFKNAKHQASL